MDIKSLSKKEISQDVLRMIRHMTVTPTSRGFDLFGQYIANANVTFKPKDKVKINTVGPFNQQFGYIVSFEGNDKYSVSITLKDKPGITLTFHKSELLKVETA